MRAPLLAAVPAGLAAGSAAGAALTRWPAGVRLGRPARSRCDTCAVPVGVAALVPVLGWLALRGRCAACRARIDGRQPALELAGAAVAAAAVAVPPVAVGVPLAIVGVAVALATALDLAHRWIPDRLTLPLGATVLPLALAVAASSEGAPARVLVHGLVVPSGLEAIRRVTAVTASGPWLGGGDVKLLVPVLAVAALVPYGPWIVWAGAVASGGLVAVVGLATGRLRRGARLPFVPFLAAGWALLLAARLVGAAP